MVNNFWYKKSWAIVIALVAILLLSYALVQVYVPLDEKEPEETEIVNFVDTDFEEMSIILDEDLQSANDIYMNRNVKVKAYISEIGDCYIRINCANNNLQGMYKDAFCWALGKHQMEDVSNIDINKPVTVYGTVIFCDGTAGYFIDMSLVEQ